jgi:hypothetical protein
VVLGCKPSRLLLKLPVPLPSLVVLALVVGFGLVLQHTPRWVTAAPPVELTVPPLFAENARMPLASAVLTVGGTGLVLNCSWLP